MGWLLALLVFIVALFTALGLLAGEKLLWWLIAALALAFLLGGGWPTWLHLPARRP